MPAARADTATAVGMPPPGREGRHEAGVVVIWFALGLTTFLAICGLAVDIGNWYYQAGRLQKAADAAALSGVISLPGDPNTATATVKSVSSQNGFTDGSGGVVVTACPGQTSFCPASMTPAQASQLTVAVSKSVPTYFSTLVGLQAVTITRRATAEYQQPVNLGSPANIIGNEPVDPALGEIAWNNTLTFNPHMWGNIMGPQSTKTTGDAVQSYLCTAGPAQQCSGGTPNSNSDYNPDGYLYLVNVNRALHPGQSLEIQVFDPAAVAVGDHCEENSNNIKAAAGKLNPYTNAVDSLLRYRWGDTTTNPGLATQMPGVFCTADNNGEDIGNAPTTTYVVRKYLSAYGPLSANPPVASGTCAGDQFQGYGRGTVDLSHALDQTNPGYNDALAKVFRQWVPICTFSPDSFPPGAYLIQVRTDIALGATQAQMAGAGDPTIHGGGSNRFSIRASWFSGGVRQPSTDVTVAGLSTMGLYAQAKAGDPAPNFFTARVLPGSAGQTLQVRLWDIGDCGSGCGPGSVRLSFQLADGYTGTCTISYHYPLKYETQIATGCGNFPALDPGGNWDGNNDYFVIDMPIPKTYTCNVAVATDCWATMIYSTTSGALLDTTTWSAEILGNPVRLIQ